MSLTLNEEHLRRLCTINNFTVPTDQMIFVGLRGCLPLNPNDHAFQSQHKVQLEDLNYVNPRCTLIQWRPAAGTFALFPGSTVPNLRFVKQAKALGGRGTNQLLTGYYKDYRKGVHKAGSITGHEAFRQNENHPIRRSSDDFDFDNDDRVEFANPFDNMHAAWCQSVNSTEYASRGCQVIIGFPKCKSPNRTADIGPWREFKANAYRLAQNSFPYVLLTGRDAQSVATNAVGTLPARVRFGSDGDLVSKVQTALQENGFYEGIVDGDFSGRTIRAVLEYQTATFGANADDGIVGPMTAAALKIKSWPTI